MPAITSWQKSWDPKPPGGPRAAIRRLTEPPLHRGFFTPPLPLRSRRTVFESNLMSRPPSSPNCLPECFPAQSWSGFLTTKGKEKALAPPSQGPLVVPLLGLPRSLRLQAGYGAGSAYQGSRAVGGAGAPALPATSNGRQKSRQVGTAYLTFIQAILDTRQSPHVTFVGYQFRDRFN